MESVLGVKGVLGAKPQSWLDRLAMMREGIPAAAVESIIGAVHLSQAQLARVLGISERALAGRRTEQRRIIQVPLLGSGCQPRA